MPHRRPHTREPDLAKDVEIHMPGATPTGMERGTAADLQQPEEATAGGTRELARAFQANAEALAGMHEIQADLAKSLKRGDRSELVLQSTQALNETFRNLTTIQRQMLTQMQEQSAASRRSPLVPLMILGLLVVLLGGVYLIVDQMQRVQPSADELARAQEDGDRNELTAYRDGQQRGRDEAKTQITALRDEFERSKLRIHALEGEREVAQEEIDALERSKRSTEVERDDYAERVMKAQNEAMARRLVEDTARSQKADLVVLGRQKSQLEIDLEQERARSELLMKRLASYGMGIDERGTGFEVTYPDRAPAGDAPAGPPTPIEDNPSSVPPAPDASTGPGDLGSPPTARPGELPSPTVRSPGTPPALDATPEQPRPTGVSAEPLPLAWRQQLNTNVALSKNIRRKVNSLLAGGVETTQHKSSWRLTKLGGVTQDLLGDVLLLQYDSAGHLIGQIEAEQLRVVANSETGDVAFVLRNGRRIFRGKSEVLPSQGASLVVARGRPQVTLWHGSGLVMVHNK